MRKLNAFNNSTLTAKEQENIQGQFFGHFSFQATISVAALTPAPDYNCCCCASNVIGGVVAAKHAVIDCIVDAKHAIVDSVANKISHVSCCDCHCGCGW